MASAELIPKLVPVRPYGPKAGGTLISVQGVGFFQTTTITCGFTCGVPINASSTAQPAVETTPAYYVDAKHVVCVSPPWR